MHVLTDSIQTRSDRPLPSRHPSPHVDREVACGSRARAESTGRGRVLARVPPCPPVVHVSVSHLVPHSLFTRVRSHPDASVHTADRWRVGSLGDGSGGDGLLMYGRMTVLRLRAARRPPPLSVCLRAARRAAKKFSAPGGVGASPPGSRPTGAPHPPGGGASPIQRLQGGGGFW